MNPYRKLIETIPTPAGLNEKVLRTAGQREAARQPRRGWVKPILRGAVCTVCALALVVGTITVAPADSGAEKNAAGGGTVQFGYSFGLTALAADTGNRATPEERVVPDAHREDGKLAFVSSQGSSSPEDGDYTGILFQITGEGIERVSMSLDRGGFYRYLLHDNLTTEQIREYRKAAENGELEITAACKDDDTGMWRTAELEALGGTVSEEYDPSLSYGFYVPPEDYTVVDDPNVALREQSWRNIDLFDGGTLSITVTFEDGSEQTREYRLHTGRLRVEYRNDLRDRVVLAEVVSEGSNEPFIYGIYTEPIDATEP